jgi:hypothetical protein
LLAPVTVCPLAEVPARKVRSCRRHILSLLGLKQRMLPI